MQIWGILKKLSIGYCVGFTAASCVCTLTGAQREELRHSFFSFVCFCISWFLFNAIKLPRENKGEYDYKDGKLIFKEDHSN